MELEKKRKAQALATRVNATSEKNDLEAIFVDCIEEVRKDLMKKRLKNEISKN